MAGRSARGTGTIRKKTVTRNGKKYEYWEARYTAGVDPGTGKQIQRSITGKTQKEVSQKLRDATAITAPIPRPISRRWANGWTSGPGPTWAASSLAQLTYTIPISEYTSSLLWALFDWKI